MAATLLIALLALWAVGGALAVSLCMAAGRADRRETRPGFAPLRLVASR